MFEALIIGVIGSLIAAVIWYFVAEGREARSNPAISANLSQYSGRWYGIHLTKKVDGCGFALSHHIYDLTVNKKGKIKGKMIDQITTPPWKMNVHGQFSGSDMVLVMKGGPRPGFFASQIHADVHLDGVNYGIASSIDSLRNAFSAPIAFSKRPVTERDLANAIIELRSHFYTEMATDTRTKQEGSV